MTIHDMQAWRDMAAEKGIDCTLRVPEIKCVREHIPVPGDDFMPYGWCGGCEICLAMPNPDVCEYCSYDDHYDLRQPVVWPCTTEMQRKNAEDYARFREEARVRFQERMARMGDREL